MQGVPLVQTIEMIGKGHNNGNMQKLLADIGNKLQSGIPLIRMSERTPPGILMISIVT